MGVTAARDLSVRVGEVRRESGTRPEHCNATAAGAIGIGRGSVPFSTLDVGPTAKLSARRLVPSSGISLMEDAPQTFPALESLVHQNQL